MICLFIMTSTLKCLKLIHISVPYERISIILVVDGWILHYRFVGIKSVPILIRSFFCLPYCKCELFGGG